MIITCNWLVSASTIATWESRGFRLVSHELKGNTVKLVFVEKLKHGRGKHAAPKPTNERGYHV